MKKDLNKLRDDIDKIDSKLLDLISKRSSIAQKVGKLKGDGVIYKPEREAQVLLRLIKEKLVLITPLILLQILQQIMTEIFKKQ